MSPACENLAIAGTDCASFHHSEVSSSRQSFSQNTQYCLEKIEDVILVTFVLKMGLALSFRKSSKCS